MLFGVLSALVLSTLTAYFLMRPFLISLGFSIWAITGLSYFLGLGMVTQIFTSLWLVGIPISLLNILCILLPLLAWGIYRNGFFQDSSAAASAASIKPFKEEALCNLEWVNACRCLTNSGLTFLVTHLKFQGTEKVFCLLVALYIVFNFGLIFLSAAALPVYAWDSITSEAYKAKMVFFTGSLTPIRQAFYPEFPFYTLSAMSWTMFVQGVWDDQYIHLIFAFALLAFTVVFFDICRRFAGRWGAFLSLLLLLSSNLLVIHATLSYRDIFMMAHTSLCVIGLLLWGNEGKNRFILFAGLFGGLSLLTKIEALPYYPVYLAILVLTGVLFNKGFRAILYSAGAFLIVSRLVYLPFQIYKLVSGAGDQSWTAPVRAVEGPALRLGMITERFINELFLFGNWNIFFWPLFIMASVVLIFTFKRDRLGIISFVSVLLFFGVYAVTFFLTGVFNSIREPYTISRYFMHFYPLSILLIVRVFYLAYEERKNIDH